MLQATNASIHRRPVPIRPNPSRTSASAVKPNAALANCAIPQAASVWTHRNSVRILRMRPKTLVSAGTYNARRGKYATTRPTHARLGRCLCALAGRRSPIAANAELLPAKQVKPAIPLRTRVPRRCRRVRIRRRKQPATVSAAQRSAKEDRHVIRPGTRVRRHYQAAPIYRTRL